MKDVTKRALRPDYGYSEELLMDPLHHDDIIENGSHVRHHERSKRYELNDT